MATYGIENATFDAMMYQGREPLKTGEDYCPYCEGFSIRPIPRERGTSAASQRYANCGYCGGKGKIKAKKYQ